MEKLEHITENDWARLRAYRARVFDLHASPGGDLEVAEAALRALLKDEPKKVIHGKGPRSLPKGITNVEFHSGWAASYHHYKFCGDLVQQHLGNHPFGEDARAQLKTVLELADNSSLVLSGNDGVYAVLPRPETRWTDDRFDPESPVLHCADGPSIRYPDGSTQYHWRGTRVPKEWIRQAPTVKDALQHENLELRRCAAEILGWDKVLDELPHTIINEDDPEVGVLIEADLPDSGKTRFLRVRCGTGRDFVLCVPMECETALEANAWTYGLKAEDYQLEIRT